MMDDFLLRALAAGFGVAIIAGPLGSFVVWRRLAFFGETLAHSALLGVALGLVLHFSATLGIIAVALLIAVLLVAGEGQGGRGRPGLPTDTLLGILAHTALAAGLVALALIEPVRIDLMAYLFGDILAVGTADILWIYGTGAVAMAVLIAIWRPLLAVTIDAELARVEGVKVRAVRLVFVVLMALVIAVSLKIVGIVLITSLLVIPAAAARGFARTPEQMAVGAALIGCAAVALGMAGSFHWDTPSGPSIVLAAALIFAVVSLWPRRPRRSSGAGRPASSGKISRSG